MSSLTLSFRIWFLTSLSLVFLWLTYFLIFVETPFYSTIFLLPVSLIISTPVLIALIILIPIIKRLDQKPINKIQILIGICILSCTAYSLIFLLLLNTMGEKLTSDFLMAASSIFLAAAIALFISQKQIKNYFNSQKTISHKPSPNSKNKSMEHFQTTPENKPISIPKSSSKSTKIGIKAVIIAALILGLMIPTIFISNLVQERKYRQKEVVDEVSSKWASPQLLSGPYLNLPYQVTTVNSDKKISVTINELTILPDNISVNGKVNHEIRKRSIYEVILYRADLNSEGIFNFKLPEDIKPEQVKWDEASICYGLSDFKGIEEKLIVDFNGKNYELSPGLPTHSINKIGLSAPISFSEENLNTPLTFKINAKIKGSKNLEFLPFAGDSKYDIQSDWPSPSFDGNILPSSNSVSDSGFNATWHINKANLPFGTVLRNFSFDSESIAFGVTLLQPTDAYAKTDRSVKYAILFIGLTFSIFFIIEIMQKKPVHVVQYILIGLALVIFYTLLLSLSEYLKFDIAYWIAALATIILISFYAHSHFKSAKTAAIFFSVLSLLYAFIFVLIRLEDSALLIGSIGLFAILAMAMYASRKVNWYGSEKEEILATSAVLS